MTTHVIQDGETLSDIAEDYFGSPHQWMVIWNANKSRILNPDRLKVGTSIVIPQ
jgi:nucleoid-associated protein YgaU